MNKLFDTATVVIKEKEYTFIKPKAVFVIRLEDSCMNTDGTIDLCKYIDGHLKFVDRELGIEAFDKEVDKEIKLENKTLHLKDTSMKTKLTIDSILIKGNRLNRVDAVESILSICEEEVRMEDLSYEEINNILEEYNSKINSTEVMEVFETIKTFL